jgi:hypothetical protein
MPQLCSICISPDRETIDQELISGTPVRDIAGRHGLSKSSIDRHKKHIPVALQKAREAVVVSNADTLLHQVKDLQSKALQILTDAQAAGDPKTALMAIREARSTLELLGKVSGELSGQSVNVAVGVSLLTTPEWAVMIRVLAKHSEINDELLTALQEAGL